MPSFQTDIESGWRPWLLSKRFLCITITFFVAVIIGLEALYRSSKQHNGLWSTNDDFHDIWTFSPTAAVFSRIDYRVRQLTPWRAMASMSGPVPARKSILADYTSPFILTSCFLAFKHKQFLPIVTMVGYMALKLVSVFSTGLFVLSTTTLTGDVQVKVFDAFTTSYLDDDPNDNRDFFNVFAIFRSDSEYSPGTSSQYAIPTFSTVGNNSNIETLNTTINLDIFTANMDCEVGKFLNYDSEGEYTISDSTGCKLKSSPWGYDALDPQFRTYPIYLWISRAACDNHNSTNWNMDTDVTDIFKNDSPHPPQDTDRIILSVAEVGVTDVANHFPVTYGPLKRSTHVVCKPRYELRRAAITMNSGKCDTENCEFSVDLPSDSKPFAIDDISQSNFTESVLLQVHNLPIENVHAILNSTNTLGYNCDAFFELMLNLAPQRLIEDFFDPDIITQLAKQTFTALSVQIAKHLMMVPSNEVIVGTHFYTTSRLFVQELSLRLIQSLLTLIICLTGIVIVNQTKRVVSRDPDTIAAISSILAASPDLKRQLKGTSLLDKSAMEDILGNKSYQAQVFKHNEIMTFLIVSSQSNDFVEDGNADGRHNSSHMGTTEHIIDKQVTDCNMVNGSVVHEKQLYCDVQQMVDIRGASGSRLDQVPEDVTDDSRESVDECCDWWSPVALAFPSVLLLLISPIVLVVLLETLYQISQHSHGIADVSTHTYTHFAWVYIPALVMLLIGSLVTSFDIGIKVIYPYRVLSAKEPLSTISYEPQVQSNEKQDNHSRVCHDKTSLLHNPRDEISIFALSRAMRRRQLPIILSTLAALLLPFLTIVTSGLYTANLVTYDFEHDIKQLDWFNQTSSDIYRINLMPDESHQIEIELTVDGNITYPSWSWQDLVFPKIDINLKDYSRLVDEAGPSSMTLQIPAIRTQSNCTIISNEEFDISVAHYTPDGDDSDITGVYAQMDRNFTNTLHNVHPGLPPSQHDRYLQDTEVNLTTVEGFVGSFGGIWNMSESYDNPRLQGFRALYGFLDSNFSKSTWTGMECWPYLEEVTAEVKVNLDDMLIDASSPPRILNATPAKFFSRDWIIQVSWICDMFELINMNQQLDDQAVGPFWFHAIHHVSKLTHKDLLNGTIAKEAAEKTYAIWSSQILHYRGRYDLMTPDRKSLPSTFHGAQRSRLIQNKIATRLLQSLLVAIFLCTLLAYFSISREPKVLLPMQPGTIAAIASLLVDGEMVSRDVVPEGSEWNDVDLRKIYEGKEVSLGFWGEGENKRFGIDISAREAVDNVR